MRYRRYMFLSEFEELLGNLDLPNVVVSANDTLTAKRIGYTNDVDSALKLSLSEADALDVNLDNFTLILETPLTLRLLDK